MTNSKEILTNLATVHSAVEGQHIQYIELCGFNHDGVHLLEAMFVKLFEDKREIVGRKDLTSKENPFMYFTHYSGTKFYCISNNPDLFPTYPVEKLAEDLVNEWESIRHKHQFRVAYTDGTYKLMRSCFKDDEHISTVYSYKQYESDESVTLEQAILDHMEGVHNNENK